MKRRAVLAAPALWPALAAAQTARAVAQDDTVGPGLRRNVLIRWGDRLTFDAPPFDQRMLDA